MNLQARNRHRRFFYVLAAILPILVAFGLYQRKPTPVMSELPEQLRSLPSPGKYDILISQDNLWKPLEITTLVIEQAGTKKLVLAPGKPLAEPDVILYWVNTPIKKNDVLPENALLMGKLENSGGGHFVLSNISDIHQGQFVLYSLAHQSIIGTASLPALSNRHPN